MLPGQQQAKKHGRPIAALTSMEIEPCFSTAIRAVFLQLLRSLAVFFLFSYSDAHEKYSVAIVQPHLRSRHVLRQFNGSAEAAVRYLHRVVAAPAFDHVIAPDAADDNRSAADVHVQVFHAHAGKLKLQDPAPACAVNVGRRLPIGFLTRWSKREYGHGNFSS